MKIASTCLAVCLSCLASQAETDFLRFDNGDQVSGRFMGFTPAGEIQMESEELKKPAEFRTDSLRHLVLRGGKPKRLVDTLSHAGLTNGDRIPGRVVGMDDTHFTLETVYGGPLRIPKDHVSLLALNPMGGRIHYFGPFSDDGWKLLRKKDAKEVKKDDPKSNPWEFSGSAWYLKGEAEPTGAPGAVALARTEGMSDRSVLKFRIDWKDRMAISVAFHADFATDLPAPEKEEDAQKRVIREYESPPLIFGNAYVLQIQSSHFMLYRCSMDKENGPNFDRIQMSSNYSRMGEGRSAVVEIRSNRTTGHISLFLNNEFISQWSEPPATGNEQGSFAGKGNGFGFLSQYSSGTVRISDITVSEWNGMPDSARSMELDDKDVVLMTNGTDRFAGKVLGMQGSDGIQFESRHGTVVVPLDEIAEIRFARARLAETKPDAAGSPVIHLGPLGRVSAKILGSEKDVLKLQHPIMGPMDLQLDSVIMLEYKPGTKIVDTWDVDL